MPAWVSVVMVEETGVWCAGRLAPVPVDEDEQMLVRVACPAGVAECMDDFILTMLGYCSRPTLPEYCFRPFPLGYHSCWPCWP